MLLLTATLINHKRNFQFKFWLLTLSVTNNDVSDWCVRFCARYSSSRCMSMSVENNEDEMILIRTWMVNVKSSKIYVIFNTQLCKFIAFPCK